MAEPFNGSDSIIINAPADKIWGLITDVTRVGEWSPETRSAAWTRGSTGPVVGAKFKGHNRKGWMRWTGSCEVTVADPGREFSFVRRDPDGGTTWRYVLESEDDATKVTESFSQGKVPTGPLRLFGRLAFGENRENDMVAGVRTTLQGLKASAESSAP
jgi:hypothetical protein